MMPIEVVDGSGLTEVLDPQRFHAMPADRPDPAQRRRMAIEHSDDAAVPRQRLQQSLDMAEMMRIAFVTADLSRGSPAGMETIR